MSKFWVADSFRYYLGQKVFDLTDDTIKLALISSTLASTHTVWATGTVYSLGDVRIPTSGNRNGHRYICTVGGTSHASTEPTWSIADDGTCTDGTVTWAEYGGDLCNLALWSEASGSEAANGDGYTTGGLTLTTKTLTTLFRTTTWDADDVTFSSLTKTFRFGCLYKSGTDNSIVNPIVGFIMFEDDFSDIVQAGTDFWTQFASSGIYTFTN